MKQLTFSYRKIHLVFFMRISCNMMICFSFAKKKYKKKFVCLFHQQFDMISSPWTLSTLNHQLTTKKKGVVCRMKASSPAVRCRNALEFYTPNFVLKAKNSFCPTTVNRNEAVNVFRKVRMMMCSFLNVTVMV